MTFQLTPQPQPHLDGNALDHFPTPSWVTEALLDEHPPPTVWVVEPSAGKGAIVEVLIRRGHLVHAVEFREECAADLRQLCVLPNSVGIADWLDTPKIKSGSIVGNPPFTPPEIMLAHVRHAVESGAVYVAMLLPLYWLSGGSGRRQFHREHPPQAIYYFADRPKFIGDGGQREMAWFVYDKEWKKEGRTAIKMLERR